MNKKNNRQYLSTLSEWLKAMFGGENMASGEYLYKVLHTTGLSLVIGFVGIGYMHAIPFFEDVKRVHEIIYSTLDPNAGTVISNILEVEERLAKLESKAEKHIVYDIDYMEKLTREVDDIRRTRWTLRDSYQLLILIKKRNPELNLESIIQDVMEARQLEEVLSE